jgi:hypothetical protein
MRANQPVRDMLYRSHHGWAPAAGPMSGIEIAYREGAQDPRDDGKTGDAEPQISLDGCTDGRA